MKSLFILAITELRSGVGFGKIHFGFGPSEKRRCSQTNVTIQFPAPHAHAGVMAPTYRSVGVEFLSEYLKFEPRGDLQYCLGFLVKEENAQWVADLSCGICGKEHLTFGNVYMAVSGKLRVVCGSCGLDADLQMPQLHLRDEVQLVLLPCWSFYICCIDSTDLSVLLDRQTDLCWCICHARWWCIFPTQAGHASVPHVMMSADVSDPSDLNAYERRHRRTTMDGPSYVVQDVSPQRRLVTR